MTPLDFRALPDDMQDEMTDYVTEVCQDCGNLRSVCSDPDVLPFPQRSVCHFTAAKAVAWRRVNDHHKQPDPKSQRPHFTDGLSIYASLHDLTPDDTFGGALGLGTPATNSEADDQQ